MVKPDRRYRAMKGNGSLLNRVAIVCSLCLVCVLANAHEYLKTCVNVDVLSIDISAETEHEVLLNATPEKPTIEIVPASSSMSTMTDMLGKAVTVVAVGPVLGSWDSHTVETYVACTEKGMVLMATIMRFGDYPVSIRKNVLWRPKVEMVVVPRWPDVVVEATWKIRLITGTELDHARTPPYPDQSFPITTTTTLR